MEIDCVATTGFFDGVHLGHRQLLTLLKETGVRLGLPTCVVTFDPHPRIVLNRNPEQLQILTTLEEKTRLLKDFGIEKVVALPFSKEFSEMSAEQFIVDELAGKLGVKALCVGYDHRMGHGGADYSEIKRICSNNGIFCERVEPAFLGKETISSQKIRNYLTNTRPDIACQMLGYPYSLTGTVEHGSKIGSKIGFPTANIAPDDGLKLIPSFGVYSSCISLGDRKFDGMLYVGRRPTVDTSENLVIEVNIFDFSENIYGQTITVSFERYLRGDMKFNSMTELVAQLEKDREALRIGHINGLYMDV
jgi:riboflavin kinase/FMN adenylyltransferase